MEPLLPWGKYDTKQLIFLHTPVSVYVILYCTANLTFTDISLFAVSSLMDVIASESLHAFLEISASRIIQKSYKYRGLFGLMHICLI